MLEYFTPYLTPEEAWVARLTCQDCECDFLGTPSSRPEGRNTAEVEKEEKEKEPEPENQWAMDLQRLVDIAHQFDDNGGQGPGFGRGHGPGRRGRRLRMSRATLLKLLGPKQRREREKMEKFKSQARFANSTGRNRTNDFLMPSSAGNSVLARNGKGKWKSWTPEAIQRAAFANENMAVRHTAEQVDGGSASHAIDCRLFLSQLV